MSAATVLFVIDMVLLLVALYRRFIQKRELGTVLSFTLTMVGMTTLLASMAGW